MAKQMTEAEQRTAIVEGVNCADANLALARERYLNAAGIVLETLARRHAVAVRYAEARKALVDPEAKLSNDERSALVTSVNEMLVVLDATARELQKAKSEEGTARSECKRYEEERTSLVLLLAKFLPEVSLP
jgi:hypothetical protein